MDVAWSGDERPVVGIVDEGSDTPDGVTDDGSATEATSLEDALRPILAAHDGTVVRGEPADVLAAEPSLLVTVGEAGLSALARVRPDCPVVPVGDVAGVDAVSRARVPEALEAVLEGRATVCRHPILGLSVSDGEGVAGDGATDGTRRERALFDVTLVTDEPATITEYALESDGDPVASVRADGVVVATPAGSHGYASALGAPRLSAAVEAAVVAPIGPFVTSSPQWVLPPDDVVLTVERDEGDVTVVADARPVETITSDSRVRVGVDGTLSVLSVPEDVLEGG